MLLLWVCLLTAPPVVLDGVDVTGWDTQQLWALADKYFHDGKYAEAIRVQQRIYRLDPEDVESYAVAAWLLWSLGDEPGARRILTSGVAANPNAWDSHWELGYHDLERNGDPERALPSLEQAIAQDGWPPYAIRTLAHAYLYAEQPSLAAEVWERIGENGSAPPGVVNNNLGRALELALRPDLAARSGGVLVGAPHPDAVRILSDVTQETGEVPIRWRRTIALEAAEGADGVPDMRIYLLGSAVVYKKVWSWAAIECDSDRDGRFSPAEMLLDEDGDGFAESLPPIEALQALRKGLTPNECRVLSPDRYELGVDETGAWVPFNVQIADGELTATPACYIATALDSLELRLQVVEAVEQSARYQATAPLPAGVYCANRPGGSLQAEVAVPIADLPPGQYAVALEIGYRTANLDQKLLRDVTLVRDEQGARLTASDAWALYQPPEPPEDSLPAERATPAGATGEQGHKD